MTGPVFYCGDSHGIFETVCELGIDTEWNHSRLNLFRPRCN